MSYFDKSIIYTLGNEGRYTDNPVDNGNWTGGKVGAGELKGTNFGISAATYPHVDIKNLTKDQAIAIYRRDFWNQAYDQITDYRIAAKTFDNAVNMGSGQAHKLLQRAAMVKDDGVIGPQTIAAVNSFNPDELLNRLIAEQLDFYEACVQKKPSNKVFLAGWKDRAKYVPEIA